jgi:hypothetical protein
MAKEEALTLVKTHSSVKIRPFPEIFLLRNPNIFSVFSKLEDCLLYTIIFRKSMKTAPHL